MSHLKPHFIIVILALAIFTTPSPTPRLSNPASINKTQTSAKDSNPCQWKQRIKQVLSQLYNEYAEIEKKPAIRRLVILDRKLRRFFKSRPEDYPCGYEDGLWEGKYAKLGVHLDSGGLLMYSGKLLVDAHRMNPKSKYRKYTLFSTIIGIEPAHHFGVMPNIKAAYRYEKEFPDGPFVEETLSIIADFNKDLYMVLRDDRHDYKYNCFKPYIDASPRSMQMERARRKAMSYYEKVLAINPTNVRAKEFLVAVGNGTVARWSFCAD